MYLLFLQLDILLLGKNLVWKKKKTAKKNLSLVIEITGFGIFRTRILIPLISWVTLRKLLNLSELGQNKSSSFLQGLVEGINEKSYAIGLVTGPWRLNPD